MSKTGFATDILKSFIERVERLNEEKDALSADIREVFAEAKGSGFDTKTMRKVIARRKLDKADLQEQDAMLDLYVGALEGTPLGSYATRGPAAPKAAAPKPESQATADADAPAKANTKSAAGEESVSRGADARSSAATTEIMVETGGERAAPSMELPTFMDRRPKTSPPQPSA